MALWWHPDQGTAAGNGLAEHPARLGPDQLGLARRRAGGPLLCSENPADKQRCRGSLGFVRSRSGLWLPPMDFVWGQGSALSPSAARPPRGRDPRLLPDLQATALGLAREPLCLKRRGQWQVGTREPMWLGLCGACVGERAERMGLFSGDGWSRSTKASGVCTRQRSTKRTGHEVAHREGQLALPLGRCPAPVSGPGPPPHWEDPSHPLAGPQISLPPSSGWFPGVSVKRGPQGRPF